MKTHTLLILLIAIIGNACTNEKKKDINSQSFYTIDFPDILKNQQEVFLSDIALGVEYVRLSTTSSCLLGRIIDAKFTKKYIFIEKDPEGDTLRVVNNNYFWDKSKRSYRINNYWGRNAFYRLDNKLHFKGWYNDTIYTYDSWNKITPNFFIDLLIFLNRNCTSNTFLGDFLRKTKW